MIDDVYVFQVGGWNWLCGKQYFFGNVDMCGIQESEQVGDVVWYVVLGWGGGKSGVWCGDDYVVGEYCFVGVVLDVVFDYCDDWCWEIFQFVDQLLQWVVLVEWIGIVGW